MLSDWSYLCMRSVQVYKLPPPKGAQMTRLMALTQSSMSFWEFAMSRKASWLRADLSFSPVQPMETESGKN